MKDETNTKSPIEDLCRALSTDRGYLISWHSNLAVSFMDAGADWKTSQDGARRFIATLFANRDDAPEPITNEEVRGGSRDEVEDPA